MPAGLFHLPNDDTATRWAPKLIVAGLLVLLAAGWWPTLPTVTALAVIMLGATWATVERFRGTPALALALVVHLAVYGGLYALFVGATLHDPTDAGGRGGLATAIDLAASIWPMAAALGFVGDGLRGTRSVE